MAEGAPLKLLPRNVAALRRGQDAATGTRVVAGNSVSTRLESGVGNCFPGLEFDMRNLERRFFPFLEVDLGGEARVASVNVVGVNAAAAAGALSSELAQRYHTIASDLEQGRQWRILRIDGDFGPLGQQSVMIANLDGASFGPNRPAPDAWTAVRLLREDTPVTLVLRRRPGTTLLTLTGRRMRYLDDNGALARIFEPGELTQSLCSPWTHDFRDCGCFYWATNHPDIALPPLPTPPPPATETRWNSDTAWLRSERSVQTPPVATAAGPAGPGGTEIEYHRITRDWQVLNFILERRERLTPYQPSAAPAAQPLAGQAELITHLRYAAGVEQALMLEYLTAAWSLRRPVPGMSADLANDLRTAFAEILRVAISEMRHLDAINDVLRGFVPSGSSFVPALAPAAEVPTGTAGNFRPVTPRPATPTVIGEFILVEAPSLSVDGLYARILATFEAGLGNDEQEQLIRTVMAEGEDHWQTFQFVREWLRPHAPATYLRGANLQPPPPGNTAHATLQQRYRALLNLLDTGYRRGLPVGAPELAQARTAMLGDDGIEGALEAVASQAMLAVFDPITNDPRFAPVARP